MQQRGLDHIPIIANVYVPTATIAKLMQSGEVPGCVIPDRLIQKLGQEKKPQRLERAALMVAAVKDLGFAGAHVGGFGLKHADFMTIIEKAEAIGSQWKERMDDLIFDMGPDDFYLYPKGSEELSDASQLPTLPRIHPRGSFPSKMFHIIHNSVVHEKSPFGKYFEWKMKNLRQKYGENWERGLTYHLLDFADVVKKATLGCVQCGDCMQDYMGFSGCSMGKCIKETRNGPCGGSRVDGTCEVDPEMQCVWSASYCDLLASGEDPSKFASNLIPPRNWELDKTNSLANYFAEIDNNHLRTPVEFSNQESQPESESS
jgi:methylenetetrahydrofolate reductase (NADPH)